MTSVRAHILVSGRVQGVWYRGRTKEKAESIGIVGWVKNVSNGNVEAVFEGSEEKIRQMITWCREGPEHARVEDIQVEFEEASGEYDHFSITY